MYSVGENDRRFPILVTGDAVHPIQKKQDVKPGFQSA